MFGSNVLEVAIGLVSVYWFLGLLCSTINEQVIVPLVNLRGRFLEEGIKNMLADPQGDKLVNQLYETPLIKGLSRKASSDQPRKPSYIPADIFAAALMSLDVVQAYKDNPKAENSPIPQALASLLDSLGKDPAIKNEPAIVLASIEKWYNDTMDRVSGWYKRRVQLIIFLLGLVIVVGLNVDTVSLITSLSNNTTARSALVSAAQGAANAQNNSNLATIQKDIAQLQPVIGWTTLPTDLWSWLLKVVGLLATTFAVSLGAPFWFDLLNKFINFRSSGPPPQSKAGARGSTSAPPQQLVVAVSGPPPQTGTNRLGTAGSTGTTE